MLTSLKIFVEEHLSHTSFLWKVLAETNNTLRSIYEPIIFHVAWLLKAREITNINFFERRIYSQNGEDGIIKAMFKQIGTTNKFFVEFGVEDGKECNTRYLKEKQGWQGLWMDGNPRNSKYVKKEFLTAENINAVFKKYRVPKEFDLLSIDIDGNDYWVWKALKDYSPRVVVMEYNGSFLPTESKAVKYDPKFKWDDIRYRGASLLAMVKLGINKGYTLVGVERRIVNAFFVRNDLIKGNFKVGGIMQLYKPSQRGVLVNGVRSFPPSNKKMIDV